MIFNRQINYSLSSIVFTFLIFAVIGCGDKFSGRKSATRVSVGSAQVTEVTSGSETRATMVLQNGLEVLLVSNPQFTKASAAMAVPVGSWSDPVDHQGLTHFLEHMLFLGTKDYPEPDGFMRFATSNGGYTNAYTARNLTNYYFEVNPSALTEGIARFAGFFRSPTLDQQYAEKERNAVNSEFKRTLEDDGRRWYQMLNQTAPSEHPMRKLSVGNSVTLSSVDPKVLREHYEKFYSADTMKLTLISPQSIAELKTVVETHFKDVPNRSLKNTKRPHIPKYIPGKWMEIKSIGDRDSLALVFPVEAFGLNWAGKPDAVLSALLGSERSGSLASILRHKHLARNVSVYTYDPVSTGYDTGFLIVQLELTNQGARQRDFVLATFFSVVGQLSREGIKDYTFDESKALLQTKMRLRGAVDGGNEAARLAALMLIHPALEADQRSMLMSELSPNLVENYLKAMTPENMTVLRMHPAAVTNNREAHYAIEYKVSSIPNQLKGNLRAALKTVQSEYVYPLPNTWFPADFSLKKDNPAAEPRVLTQGPNGKLWFLQEAGEGTQALAYSSVRIYSPEIARSPRNYLLTLLYAKAHAFARADRMAPYLETGVTFGTQLGSRVFEPGIRVLPTYLEFNMRGYSDKFDGILTDLLASSEAKLSDLAISNEDLDFLKDELRRQFKEEKVKDGMTLAIEHSNYLANSPGFQPHEYEGLLDSVTTEEFAGYTKDMFRKIYVEGLIYGNVAAASFENLIETISKNLSAEDLTEEELLAVRNRQNIIISGQKFVSMISGLNNNNAMLIHLDTGARSPLNAAKTAVLGKLIDRDYFNELRTKQQLGYLVQGGAVSSNERTGLSFRIQSAAYGPEELAKRTDTYLGQFVSAAGTTLDKKFEAIRAALIEELSRKTKQMSERFEILEILFKGRRAEWGYTEAVVAELRTLKKEDVMEHLQNSLVPQRQARLAVLYSAKNQAKPFPKNDEVLVHNQDEFNRLRAPAQLAPATQEGETGKP